MARKAASNTKTRTTASSRKTVSQPGVLDYFRFGESYTSLILGIVVVIIIAILLISFVRNRATEQIAPEVPEISSTKIEPNQQVNPAQDRYTVRPGDTLWAVAENVYQSGYNWVDIAKANNLSDANLLTAGQVLVIPTATRMEITTEAGRENKIEESSYTVVEGDNLWDIAVRRYNDGYRWSEIATSNEITNPDYIEVGTSLRLP